MRISTRTLWTFAGAFLLAGYAWLLHTRSSRAASDEEVLYEAARQRLRLKTLKVGDSDLSAGLEKTEDPVTRKAYVAMFSDLVTRELLMKDPSASVRAEAAVKKRQPRLYRLTSRAEEEGDQSFVVLAADTRLCPQLPRQVFIANARVLDEVLCVDTLLEGPGDILVGRHLQVEAVDLASIEQWPEAAARWDALVQGEARKMAIASAIENHRQSSRSTKR